VSKILPAEISQSRNRDQGRHRLVLLKWTHGGAGRTVRPLSPFFTGGSRRGALNALGAWRIRSKCDPCHALPALKQPHIFIVITPFAFVTPVMEASTAFSSGQLCQGDYSAAGNRPVLDCAGRRRAAAQDALV
jgi:hypothetical protein